MKIIFLLAALCTAAHAQIVVFTFSGTTNYITNNAAFTLGNTVTAQLSVDLSTLDTNASPAVGSYPSTGTALVQFSNSLTFSNVPFKYEVVNNLTPMFMTLPYDAVAFYFDEPTFQLGFEMRFSTATFSDDFAATPTQVTLIPQGSAEIPNPTNWFYSDLTAVGYSMVSGPIDSFSIQAVPEPSTCAAILGAAALTAATIQRRRTAKPRSND